MIFKNDKNLVSKKILVLGSINIDYVSYVKRFPKPGETLFSTSLLENNGGKGANQAVACSRMNSSKKPNVSIFAKVGKNHFNMFSQSFKSENINCDNLTFSETEPTGMAKIIVSKKEKDNIIIVNNGVNYSFGPEDVARLTKAINSSDIILMQLEPNRFLIDKTIELSKNQIIVLNASPIENLDSKWFKSIDWLVFNENEFMTYNKLELVKFDVKDLSLLKKHSNALHNQGVKKIIVTLGANGVFISSMNKQKHFPCVGKNIDVLDSTAGGDVFLGAFIQEFYRDENVLINEAIKFGMKAAEICISRKGAWNSIPTRSEVIKGLIQNQ